MPRPEDEPKLPPPVPDLPGLLKAGKKGKAPTPPGPREDFRTGDFRCMSCGAAFATRKALDRHTESGHSVNA